MSTSCATVEPETFDWTSLGGDTVSVVYESLEDMHTAPVHLSGDKALRFAEAKRRRARRAAPPLTFE